jgi:cysteine synthase A
MFAKLLASLRVIPINSEVLPSYRANLLIENRAQLHIALLYENEAKNGKLWPALSILMRGVSRGDHKDADMVIDSTSGNYGVALAVALRWIRVRYPDFPIKRVVVVIPRSLPKGKRALLIEHGIELIEAEDSIDAMRVAERVAKERGYWYTKQYWNTDNSLGYHPIADYIADQYPMIGMAGCGVGSGGCCSGIMPVLEERFKDRDFDFHRVAVVVETGQKVGGVRDEKALEPGSLEWRAPHIDDVRFVKEEDSYRCSAAIWRQRDITPESACLGGPSTGFVIEGVCYAVRRLVIMRKFEELRAPDGFVHIIVPSIDTRAPYRPEYEEQGIYLPNSEWA